MQRLQNVLSFLTHLYLLRFPLLTAIAVVGIWAAAFFTNARSLLGNLFDVSWPGGIFYLSLTAFVTAWVVMLTWRLVLLYGAERFATPVYQVSPNVKWWHLALSGLIALPVVCGAVYYSTRPHIWEVAEALLGLLVALEILLLATIVQKWFTRPRFTQRPPDTSHGSSDLAQTSPDILFPSQNRLVAQLIERVQKRNPAPRLAGRITALFRLFPEDIWRGYFAYHNHQVVSILPGHGLAAILFLLTLLLYVLVGISKFVWLSYFSYFPALAYALLLLMVLCWGLSGFAFFLDRFRIPVLLPLLLWLFLTSQFPWSDHFYPLIEGIAASDQVRQPTTSSQPLTAERLGPGNSIIVVAANGGGIQAAAWAARVLTGLETELGDRFGGAIRLISSISGGSVGVMYFVNEYTPNGPPSRSDLESIVERATGSSLGEIGWGLVYPDFLRLLTSYGSSWDRGRALEEAWLRHDLPWDTRENIKAGLSKWRQDAVAGWRPGVILNATIADTGERLPLSTIELPPDSEGSKTQGRLFKTLNSKDIPIVTATRLSASFPYVSPAARANISGSSAAHIVDGGYYDNYGMSSLVEWLDYELSKGDSHIKRVLVLQIRGARTGGEYAFKTSRGWFYQAFAPVATLLHVRNTGQLSHNEIELNLLRDKWGKTVQITPVVFEFAGADPPLSWHLNQNEKQAIEEDWKAELNGHKKQRDSNKSGLDMVKEFLEQSLS
jgi:hypothetical protein